MTDLKRTDPRARQLAETRYRNGFGAAVATAWDQIDADIRQHFISEADAWLRAAVEAGIAPPAERPTPKHNAVWVDEEGFLYGEYQTAPSSHGDAILRLVWAAEVCSSKREMEDRGAEFRLLGWSQ